MRVSAILLYFERFLGNALEFFFRAIDLASRETHMAKFSALNNLFLWIFEFEEKVEFMKIFIFLSNDISIKASTGNQQKANRSKWSGCLKNTPRNLKLHYLRHWFSRTQSDTILLYASWRKKYWFREMSMHTQACFVNFQNQRTRSEVKQYVSHDITIK